MLAIFPGFLFRKCYYSGEFTKQFNQSKDIDKILWNIFFSGFGILSTLLLVVSFKRITGLEILESLNYENINKIIIPISKNDLPAAATIENTYIDILTIVSLIYIFSIFFGLMCHWIVRVFRLDVRFSLFRFKNYWFYYIHGGSILYNNKSNRKHEFTIADVLCNTGIETVLYKGIVSQYTISKEGNNLENLFLTEARALIKVKDDNGKTIEVRERTIPGAAFCIPNNTIVNLNFFYVYKKERPRAFDQFYLYSLNIFFILAFTSSIILLFFDLSRFNIIGFWDKTNYLILSIVFLTNLRLLLSNFVKKSVLTIDVFSPILLIFASLSFFASLIDLISIWYAVGISMILFGMIGFFRRNKPTVKVKNDAPL